MVNGLHILLVEDDPQVADVLEEALTEIYRTSRARTEIEACACLDFSPIDLIVLDRTLPDGRGETLIAMAERIGVPIIAMSGYPDEIRNLEESGQPHLIKPFGVTTLLARIESVLNTRRLEAASVLEREGCSRLNGVKERSMLDFCCDMLDERGGILFSADITAETQEAAIQHASDILRTNNRSSASQRVCAFEVWSGTNRLFPSQ
jgi:DNA-binding response OmpR family regulator